VIFANGLVPDRAFDELHPEDWLIAADGGARHCLRRGLTPHVLIGDLDSLGASERSHLEQAGVELILHPVRKDHTDLELALQLARARGADEVLLLGAYGGRWDHTLANFLLLASAADIPRLILSDGCQRAIRIEGEMNLEGAPGDVVSLLPLGGDAVGVTTQGLEYPLQDGILHLGSGLGVSNVMTGDQARIGVRSGVLLCLWMSVECLGGSS
jgi:thiamine pyrophosphokinase